jgi:hypothetical protein
VCHAKSAADVDKTGRPKQQLLCNVNNSMRQQSVQRTMCTQGLASMHHPGAPSLHSVQSLFRPGRNEAEGFAAGHGSP